MASAALKTLSYGSLVAGTAGIFAYTGWSLYSSLTDPLSPDNLISEAITALSSDPDTAPMMRQIDLGKAKIYGETHGGSGSRGGHRSNRRPTVSITTQLDADELRELGFKNNKKGFARNGRFGRMHFYIEPSAAYNKSQNSTEKESEDMGLLSVHLLAKHMKPSRNIRFQRLFVEKIMNRGEKVERIDVIPKHAVLKERRLQRQRYNPFSRLWTFIFRQQ